MVVVVVMVVMMVVGMVVFMVMVVMVAMWLPMRGVVVSLFCSVLDSASCEPSRQTAHLMRINVNDPDVLLLRPSRRMNFYESFNYLLTRTRRRAASYSHGGSLSSLPRREVRPTSALRHLAPVTYPPRATNQRFGIMTAVASCPQSQRRFSISTDNTSVVANAIYSIHPSE